MMAKSSRSRAMPYATPRSPLRPTWSSIALSVILGGVTLSILPLLDFLAVRTEDMVTVRPAPDVVPPPLPVPAPPEPPTEPPTERPTPRWSSPRPRSEPVRREIEPLEAPLALSLPIGTLATGDVRLDFEISPEFRSDESESLVFGLDEVDAPPRALVRMKPIYPRTAERERTGGEVELSFVITAEGRVEDVKVLRSEPGNLFVPAAVAAVKRWRFTIPRREGEPVAVRARQLIRFEIPE